LAIAALVDVCDPVSKSDRIIGNPVTQVAGWNSIGLVLNDVCGRRDKINMKVTGVINARAAILRDQPLTLYRIVSGGRANRAGSRHQRRGQSGTVWNRPETGSLLRRKQTQDRC
jgi:hypothetical protein